MSLAVAQIEQAAESSIHILVVEDDETLREAVTDTLELANFKTSDCGSGEAALDLLKVNSDIALVVSDVNMGGMSGYELLKTIRQQYPQIPVLLITAYASVSQSVEAMRDGAVDYLVKPFDPQQLVETVNRYASPTVDLSSNQPIAVAQGSCDLLRLAQRVAQSESTVLVVGESGTGKEVLARYIHAQSARADQPFVAINCAAIPENMLEAMLFGHEKGAYTGAYSSAPGKFEQANGGTLLLDEISEMDIGLQAKLLRVLQEKEVERLGGRKTISLDVRVIATSNRNLKAAVANGQFREDLYYRLSVLPLQWAPLRERRDDIAPLAEQLLHRHATKQHRNGVRISDSAKRALEEYPWPGNVRELDNMMQRALILQTGPVIAENDLGLDFNQSLNSVNHTSPEYSGGINPSIQSADHRFGNGNGSNEFGAVPVSDELNATDQRAIPGDYGTAGPDFSEGIAKTDRVLGGSEFQNVEYLGNTAFTPSLSDSTLGSDLKQKEFEIILNALRMEGGSRKRCAERLQISPRTLRYKIAKLREQGLDVNAAARKQ